MEIIVGELAHFLGIAPEEVLRRLRSYTPQQMADEWNAAKPDIPEKVKAFYRETDKYLYELPGWNLTSEYVRRITPLLHYTGKKILEIGAGIGSLCIALAQNGNEVTYCDINEPCFRFATQRFVERYLTIKMVKELKGLRDYDIVVANDLFEHIHPDELPEMIKDIAHSLKDGGFLYHRSNFGQQDIFPMHFNNEGLLDKLCLDNKLLKTTRGDYLKGNLTKGVQVGMAIEGPDARVSTLKCMSELETPPGTILTTAEHRPIDFARNFIVKALKRDWLFFMDSDQTFPPGALKRLLSYNMDIVSGLVFKRTDEPVPMIYKYCWEEGKGHYYKPMVHEVGEYLTEHKELWLKSKGAILLPPIFKGKNILLEIDGASAGCLLVNKRVFDAIKEPWFQCDEGTRAGEDFYFCRKAQEAGFKIMADPGVICGHFAEQERDIRHFMSWANKTEYPWVDDPITIRGYSGSGPLPPTVYPEQLLRIDV